MFNIHFRQVHFVVAIFIAGILVAPSVFGRKANPIPMGGEPQLAVHTTALDQVVRTIAQSGALPSAVKPLDRAQRQKLTMVLALVLQYQYSNAKQNAVTKAMQPSSATDKGMTYQVLADALLSLPYCEPKSGECFGSGAKPTGCPSPRPDLNADSVQRVTSAVHGLIGATGIKLAEVVAAQARLCPPTPSGQPR